MLCLFRLTQERALHTTDRLLIPPQLRLTPSTGGKAVIITADAANSSCWDATFVVPESIPMGQYIVEASNGLGGAEAPWVRLDMSVVPSNHALIDYMRPYVCCSFDAAVEMVSSAHVSCPFESLSSTLGTHFRVGDFLVCLGDSSNPSTLVCRLFYTHSHTLSHTYTHQVYTHIYLPEVFLMLVGSRTFVRRVYGCLYT